MRTIYGSFLIAVLVATALAVAHDDITNFLIYAGLPLLSGGAFLVGVALKAQESRIGRALIYFIWAGLVGAAVYEGAIALSSLQEVRVAAFTGSPTTLAAATAITGTGSLLVTRRRWQWVVVVVTMFAILLTGSRVAIASFLLTVITKRIAMTGLGRQLRPLVGIGLLITVIAIPIVFFGQFNSGPREAQGLSRNNLLEFSSTLDHSVWLRSYGHSVNLAPLTSTESLPDAQGRSFRITASPQDTGRRDLLFLVQSTIRSKLGQHYVASAYLRSDYPTQIVIGTTYSRAVCDIDVMWSRCTSPPGIGDGVTPVQFRLFLVSDNEPVEFDIFAPQLEVGTEAGPIEHTSETVLEILLNHRIAERFALLDLFDQLEKRLEALRLAFNLFVNSPIIGSGLTTFAMEAEQHTTPGQPRPLTHAHNMYLHELAANGILGLAAFLLPFVVVTYFAVRVRDLGTLLVIICAFLLTHTDIVLTHGIVVGPLWFIVGYLLSASMQGQHFGRTDH